ncbi:lipopolysaccharide biosynthesis protein [Adhaeribacter terreus]|uniref:Lipopolysaccharide biosynthesis protein n=1 Tax=Adhaeribacter terreus TaxID=529703 RepID=A0ABW0E9F1_9BACT
MNPEKKLTERTLSGFLWMITGSGIQMGLKIGVLAILARLISPKDFGIVGMAVIAVDFSKMFSQMGVGPAIVQRKELENRHLTTGLTLSICMGLFFAGLLTLTSPLLSEFFRMQGLAPVLRLVSLIFLVDSLTLVGQALMQRNMNFKTIAAVEVASYAFGYGAVGITLAYQGWGMWALAAALISQAVLHALLVVIIQPFPKKPGFEKAAFKELISFGGGMTLARLGNFLAVQGDNLVIGRMLGAGALGLYGRAYQFMVMPASLFGNALDKSLFPAMAKVQDDKARLGKAYLTGVSSIALVAIPVSMIFMILAPEIVQLLLGPKWNAVIIPFQILACSLLFRMSYKMSDSLARATGAVYRRAWRQFLYALFVVTGSYIGQFWGLPGVAVGVAGALVLNFLMMAHLSIQLTTTTWFDILKAHFPGLSLGLLTGTITYALSTLNRMYFGSGFLTLLLTVLGLGLLSALTIWQFPALFIRDDQRELLNKLLLKRFKKLPTPSAWTN